MTLIHDTASSADDCAMALKTGRLECKYEKSHMLSVRLMDAERSRTKSVEQLYVEFENDDLRWQLNQANDELAQAAKTAREARVQLYDTCKEVDRLQAISKTSSGDLQKEIAKTAAESKKHLAEKNTLSEKFSNVRSELAQLQQSKNEKHTSDGNREEITDLNTRLEETRRQLTGETDARARQERKHQQQIQEWETQRTGLEAKLETLQQKLKSMKDQLREARNTSRTNNNNNSTKTETETEDRNDARARPQSQSQSRPIPSRQNPSTRFNPEIAIATPGAVQTKIGTKKSTALPGDKSAFSITPFLNRASTFQDPGSSSGDDSNEFLAENESERKPAKNKISEREKIADRKSHDISPSGSPSKPRLSANETKAGRGRISADTNPDTATSPHSDSEDQDHGQEQEPAEEAEESTSLGRRKQSTTNQSKAAPGQQMMGKTKKRKLGAQRDISQEEEDDLSPVKKAGRKLGLGGGGGGGMARKPPQQLNAASARLPRSRVFSGPTPFSPLKRDRR